MSKVTLKVSAVTREEQSEHVEFYGCQVEVQSDAGTYKFRYSKNKGRSWSKWTSCHGHPIRVNQGVDVPPAAKIAIEYGIPAPWVSWQRHWETNIKKKNK